MSSNLLLSSINKVLLKKRFKEASLFSSETESDLNAKIINEIKQTAETYKQQAFYEPFLKQ